MPAAEVMPTVTWIKTENVLKAIPAYGGVLTVPARAPTVRDSLLSRTAMVRFIDGEASLANMGALGDGATGDHAVDASETESSSDP